MPSVMPAFVPRLRLRSEAEVSRLPRGVLVGPELEMLQQKASGTGCPVGIRRLLGGGSRWKMPSACECVLGCGCVKACTELKRGFRFVMHRPFSFEGC